MIHCKPSVTLSRQPIWPALLVAVMLLAALMGCGSGDTSSGGGVASELQSSGSGSGHGDGDASGKTQSNDRVVTQINRGDDATQSNESRITQSNN